MFDKLQTREGEEVEICFVVTTLIKQYSVSDTSFESRTSKGKKSRYRTIGHERLEKSITSGKIIVSIASVAGTNAGKLEFCGHSLCYPRLGICS